MTDSLENLKNTKYYSAQKEAETINWSAASESIKSDQETI